MRELCLLGMLPPEKHKRYTEYLDERREKFKNLQQKRASGKKSIGSDSLPEVDCFFYDEFGNRYGEYDPENFDNDTETIDTDLFF